MAGDSFDAEDWLGEAFEWKGKTIELSKRQVAYLSAGYDDGT